MNNVPAVSLGFNPVFAWPLLLAGAAAILASVWWAYRLRVRGATTRWRWVAVALRVLAVILCVLAAFRPSLLVAEKRQRDSVVLFLVDSSASMTVTDEAGGRSRWENALQAVDQSRAPMERLRRDSRVAAEYYRFDSELRELPETDVPPPDGRETALGSAMLEALKRNEGRHVAAMILHSDGASNAGPPPLTVAERFKARGIPVLAVGHGSETAGRDTRDVVVRDIVAGPAVFVKNELLVQGRVRVRGFPNQPVEVKLLVEGRQVAKTTVRATEPDQVLPVTGLKHVFPMPGEQKVSLRVEPLDGETLRANNEVGTYVEVLKGGLGVLYLQGPNFSWEYAYLIRALDASPDIRVDLQVLRRPARGAVGELPDDVLEPGKYDVVILGDIPAAMLTLEQQRALAALVDNGAGLMMLGGRSSFGAGGWRDSPLARLLPVEVHPADGDHDPDGGVKVVPNPAALGEFVMRLADSPAESAALWELLPPLPGINNLPRPKPGANLLASSTDRRPVMLSQEIGRGRAVAFAGETWVWSRADERTRAAHRRFWRQVIFWLAHKENAGENEVQLVLDRRSVRSGQKLDIVARALGPSKSVIPDANFNARVERVSPPPGPDELPEPVDFSRRGEDAVAAHFPRGEPGEYRITVTATRPDGDVLGSKSARFIVERDDRELENPAANLALLKQIAEITGAPAVYPEQLPEFIESLGDDVQNEYVVRTERRLWDNWPFFLLFTLVLTLEWLVRRRIGWV